MEATEIAGKHQGSNLRRNVFAASDCPSRKRKLSVATDHGADYNHGAAACGADVPSAFVPMGHRRRAD